MAFVALTRIRLRSPHLLLPFMLHTGRALRFLRHAPGWVVTQTRKTRGPTFWFMSVWESAADQRAHRGVGAPLVDLGKFRDWCEEIATAEWTQPSAEPPSWEEAEERLKSSARLHRVEHPSPSQRAWVISID
jgi:hypothetical protein